MQSLNLANLDPEAIATAQIAAEQLYRYAKLEVENADDAEYKAASQISLQKCNTGLISLKR